MNIESYLNTEQFKTRQELVKETNMKDRAVRNQISNLKKIRPVIYNSQTRGYRLAKEKMISEDILNGILEDGQLTFNAIV